MLNAVTVLHAMCCADAKNVAMCCTEFSKIPSPVLGPFSIVVVLVLCKEMDKDSKLTCIAVLLHVNLLLGAAACCCRNHAVLKLPNNAQKLVRDIIVSSVLYCDMC